MRQIKLRFWNPKDKCWIRPSEIEFSEEDGVAGIAFNLYGKNVVYQQFTGKLDQNGREIFEGDIVYLNYILPEIDAQNLFEITFENGAFQLRPIKLSPPPNGGNNSFQWITRIGLDENDNTIYKYDLPPPRPICDFGRIVVIGNINENPELLK